MTRAFSGVTVRWVICVGYYVLMLMIFSLPVRHGTSWFIENVIVPLKMQFSIRTEAAGAFEYLGLRVTQNDDFSITIDQNEYIETLQELSIDPARKSAKDEPLHKKEKKALRSLVGQIGWVSGQTRPDLAFDYCHLSSRVKHATRL